MTPAQTLEAREVAVGGDDLASGFDGQRGEKGIRYQISPRANFPAKPRKDVPNAAGQAAPSHNVADRVGAP
jgi:hypothetical protein